MTCRQADFAVFYRYTFKKREFIPAAKYFVREKIT